MMIRALGELQRSTRGVFAPQPGKRMDTILLSITAGIHSVHTGQWRHIAVELWTQDYVPRSAVEQSATFPTFFPSKTVIICRRLEARTTTTRHQAQAGVRQRSAAFLDNYFLFDLPLPGSQWMLSFGKSWFCGNILHTGLRRSQFPIQPFSTIISCANLPFTLPG